MSDSGVNNHRRLHWGVGVGARDGMMSTLWSDNGIYSYTSSSRVSSRIAVAAATVQAGGLSGGLGDSGGGSSGGSSWWSRRRRRRRFKLRWSRRRQQQRSSSVGGLVWRWNKRTRERSHRRCGTDLMDHRKGVQYSRLLSSQTSPERELQLRESAHTGAQPPPPPPPPRLQESQQGQHTDSCWHPARASCAGHVVSVLRSGRAP